MAQTERKQVLGVGDLTSQLISQVDEPTPVMADGTLHGNIANLTLLGTGFSAAPINLTVPVISGTEQVGETLSATAGTWDDQNAPISAYAYQWKNAGVNIGGATDDSYELQATDEGDVITVTVTATNSRGSTAATSAGTGAIAAA